MFSVNCARHCNDWHGYGGMSESEVTGRIIALLAKRDGYSKSGLAEYCGVSLSRVSKWIAGDAYPLRHIHKIKAYFGVPLKTLHDEDIAYGKTPIPLSEKDDLTPSDAVKSIDLVRALVHDKSTNPKDILKILYAASELVSECTIIIMELPKKITK